MHCLGWSDQVPPPKERNGSCPLITSILFMQTESVRTPEIYGSNHKPNSTQLYGSIRLQREAIISTVLMRTTWSFPHVQFYNFWNMVRCGSIAIGFDENKAIIIPITELRCRQRMLWYLWSVHDGAWPQYCFILLAWRATLTSKYHSHPDIVTKQYLHIVVGKRKVENNLCRVSVEREEIKQDDICKKHNETPHQKSLQVIVNDIILTPWSQP